MCANRLNTATIVMFTVSVLVLTWTIMSFSLRLHILARFPLCPSACLVAQTPRRLYNGSFVTKNTMVARYQDAVPLAGGLMLKIIVRFNSDIVMLTDYKMEKVVMRHDADNSYEDPRAFPVGDDRVVISYGNSKTGTQHARMYTLSLDPLGPEVELQDDTGRLQKNWILLNGDDPTDTHWSVGVGWGRHDVWRVDLTTGDRRSGWSTDAPASFSGIRGGTNFLPHDGKLLAIGHVKSRFPYYIRPVAYTVNSKPPYSVVQALAPFSVLGTACEYPMSIRFTDGGLLLSCGIDDDVTHVYTLSLPEVLEPR